MLHDQLQVLRGVMSPQSSWLRDRCFWSTTGALRSLTLLAGPCSVHGRILEWDKGRAHYWSNTVSSDMLWQQSKTRAESRTLRREERVARGRVITLMLPADTADSIGRTRDLRAVLIPQAHIDH